VIANCDLGRRETNSNKITGNTITGVYFGIALTSTAIGPCTPHVDLNTVSNNILGGHEALGSGVSLGEVGGGMAEKNKITGNRIVSFADGYVPNTTDTTT